MRTQNLQGLEDEQEYSTQGSYHPCLLNHPAHQLHSPFKLLHVPGANASLTYGFQPSYVQSCKDEKRKEKVARKVQAHQFYQITKHMCSN